MALIRSFQNATLSTANMVSAHEAIQEAIAYAGFTDLTASISGSTDKVISVHTGDSATSATKLVDIYNFGGDGYIKGYANSSVYFGDLHWGLNIKIIATKSAIAFASNLSAAGSYSTVCAVISKDNDGNYVVVICSLNTGSLASPYVLPRTDDYTALVSYGATTSLAFGCTSLAKIPVPSYDGTARFLDSVCFAHAAQYAVDGSVTLNNIRYYSIGGSWYLRDTGEE